MNKNIIKELEKVVVLDLMKKTHECDLWFSPLPQGDSVIKEKTATKQFITVFLEKWNSLMVLMT